MWVMDRLPLRLRHGWTVSGPLRVSTDTTTGEIITHAASIREVKTVKELFTPKAVLQIFEMDFNDHVVCNLPEKRGQSQEDKHFIEKVTQGIRQVEGHFEIPLPFRKSDLKMPNNRVHTSCLKSELATKEDVGG
jgi:hypothetical protein